MNKYTMNRIRKYFEDNPEIFNTCVEQLDDYNGYLDGEHCYSMDEFDEICFGLTSTEIALKIYYGFDADSYTTDSYGNKSYSEFNPLIYDEESRLVRRMNFHPLLLQKILCRVVLLLSKTYREHTTRILLRFLVLCFRALALYILADTQHLC